MYIDNNENAFKESLIDEEPLIDEDDKQLLADKLVTLFKTSQQMHIGEYFTSIQDLFRQFDINIDYEKKPLKDIKNILLIQLEHIGDLVLTSGLIREIRSNYPEANITFIGTTQNIDIVKYCPYINESIAIDTNKYISFDEITRFCQENLWNKQFDLSIHCGWEYNSIAVMLGLLAGAKQRIGYRSDMYDKYCYDLVYDHNNEKRILDQYFYTWILDTPFDMYSEVERKFFILTSLGLDIKSNKLECWYKDKFDLPGNKKKVAVITDASHKNAIYPFNKLKQALDQLESEDVQFLLLGKEHIDIDLSNCSNKYLNLTGKTSIQELISILSQVDTCIGPDTGPIHIAAVYGKPCLVISREAKDKSEDHPRYLSTVKRFTPYQTKSIILQPENAIDDCKEKPTYGGCCHDDPHCITQITVDEIVQAYNQLQNM